MKPKTKEYVEFKGEKIYLSTENNTVTLNLNNKDIYDLSDVFGLEFLTNLEDLDLGSNQISDLTCLKNLINLRRLNLSSNQIEHLSEISNLSNLQELNLGSNKINNLKSLKNLSNLLSLDLSRNYISNLIGIEKLTNLRTLVLNENSIKDLNKLGALENLVSLDFASNKVNKLEQLKKNMNKQISTINDLLNKTLIPIPKPILKGTKISDLTSKKNVFLTLGTDTSDGNLNLYAGLITSIYETAKDLEKSKRDWNLLASQNEKVNYYYLINKSLCSLAIIEAVQLSKDIVDNKKMKDFLLRYQKVKKRENKEIIDYESQWQEWLKSLAAELDNDINTLTTNNPNFLPAKLLSFEYAAILKSPHQAMAQLEKLEKTVSSYHLRTFDRNEKIDIRTYVAAWKSYLSLKMSDLDSAEKYLSKAKGFLGLNKWKRDQEKRLYVTEKLSQQEYLK